MGQKYLESSRGAADWGGRVLVVVGSAAFGPVPVLGLRV